MNRHQRRAVGILAARDPSLLGNRGVPPLDRTVFADTRPKCWRERLALYLFPQRWLGPGIDELGFAPGEVPADFFVSIVWRDRLRILVSGKVVLRSKLKFDQPVTAMKARSEFSVLPAWKWER